MPGRSGYTLIIDVSARAIFDGRSDVRFGVAEYVDLQAIVTPATAAPDLRWFIASDTSRGALTGTERTGGNAGSAAYWALYTAGDTAGEVTLVVKAASGPQAGTIVATRTYTVVAPTDAVMVQAPNTYVWHNEGTWSVGFLGEIFLRPTDVSFENIRFREDTVKPTVSTGYLTGLHPQDHPLGQWVPVSRGDIKSGSQVYGTDTAYGGPLYRPYGDGDFLWQIPWQYGSGIPSPGEYPVATITKADQHLTADATGKATITKKDAGPFSTNAGDRSSGYHDPN
jgi:hypothetical protein